MLQLTNINVTVAKNTLLERKVLNHISLNVTHGEFVMIIGGNGAGKTTLFNTIAGDIEPDSGSIMLNNNNITDWPSYKRAGNIARVLQDPNTAVINGMTIEENLSFAYLRGKTRGLCLFSNKKRLAYFREKLKLLDMDLENRLTELTDNLSGGQRQALSLIMAIMANSAVLLLDEITAALDPKMADLIMQLTTRIVTEDKRTTIMITHNMAHALHYGDRTLLLDQGAIIREYSKQERATLTPTDLAAVFGEV
jgi:putative ABC transport system ATP-binding protein